ncbi:MAG: DUF523 and DUF1722 domain-containing protein [Victivallales bacterium]|nr:DUF523 and DUF1722 domain-containing protein [Victivallales bacterium]
MKKIRLGVSTCLLGEKVRYDGQHKNDRYISGTLSKFFDYVPVCPEVECGLGVPREAMHLEGDADSPRLVTIHSHIDLTDRMQSWIRTRLDQLEHEALCGYIFKSQSPSSGMKNVKVFNPKTGIPVKNGVGMFARAFMERFPLLPVEEEGRLNDPGLKENFLERVFAYGRWQELNKNLTKHNFIEFHTRHKLQLMAHSPEYYRKLGQLAAAVSEKGLAATCGEYLPIFMKTLGLHSTIKKNINVLQHIMGYFKKQLSADEKSELLEIFDSYRQELIPLIVPITLLNHFIRKYKQDYLKEQYFLNPGPFELCLRNYT